jgi:hypothetical protein
MTEQGTPEVKGQQLQPAELTFSAFINKLDVEYKVLEIAQQKLEALTGEVKEKRGDPLVQAIGLWMDQEMDKAPIVGDQTTFPTIANADDAIPSDMEFLAEANFIGRFTSYGERERLEVKKGRWSKVINKQPETRDITLGRRIEVHPWEQRTQGSFILEIVDPKTRLTILYYGREHGDVQHISRNGYDLSLEYIDKSGKPAKQIYRVQQGILECLVGGDFSSAVEEGSPDLFTEVDKLVSFLNGAQLTSQEVQV